MEQYDDKYKDQYTKETSQIHAPADLIQRTKQAVSEEEKKLKMENDSATEIQKQKRQISRQKLSRWTVLAAAAAVLVLVLNMSVMLWNRGARLPQMDSGSGMEAGGSYAGDPGMNGSSELSAEESTGKASDGAELAGSTEITEGAEESDGAESAMPETGDFAAQQKKPAIRDEINADKSASSSSDRGGGDELAESDRAQQYDSTSGAPVIDTENSVEQKYEKRESAPVQITIKEVKATPDFCNDSDTKRIVCHGIAFYIAEDMDEDDTADMSAAESTTWKAYAEYNGGRYIITGQASDQNEFSERAYEILEANVKGS